MLSIDWPYEKNSQFVFTLKFRCYYQSRVLIVNIECHLSVEYQCWVSVENDTINIRCCLDIDTQWSHVIIKFDE